MDQRTGRRSISRDQPESYIISPQAARLNGGGLSGPGRQGRWPASGGPALRSRQPNHAGGTRQEAGFEDFYEDQEAETRRELRNLSGGRHQHDEDIRALLGTRNSVRGRRHDFAGEDYGLEEDSVEKHHHKQARGRLNDRFEAHNTRRGQHDDTGAGRPFGFVEEMSPFDAASTRANRHGPTSQRHGNTFQGGNLFQDVERSGGPRLGGGHRDRDRDEKARGDPNTGPFGTLAGVRGTQVDGHLQQQNGRFVPYTFQMLRGSDVNFLARIFKVHASEVKRWCERDYIRMDRKRDCETNIDPLLIKLSSRDRENYAKTIQIMEDEKGPDEPVGWGPRHVPAAYERGFDMGLASERRESKTGGHR